MLALGAYGLILFGLSALAIGVSVGLSPNVFAGDVLSGLILGIVIIVLSNRVKNPL